MRILAAGRSTSWLQSSRLAILTRLKSATDQRTPPQAVPYGSHVLRRNRFVCSRSTRESKQYDGDDRPSHHVGPQAGGHLPIADRGGSAARAVGVAAPERLTPFDLALIGIATHKTSRLLAKDAVTSPLRAPFAVYEKPGGDAELSEQPRQDSHARHAWGELVTCPFCLAKWTATGFGAGLAFAPNFTRLAALVMASTAVSDFLQLAYAALQGTAE
jgi:hypothetical protein